MNLNRRIEALEKQAPSKKYKHTSESVAETNKWIEELLRDDKTGTTSQDEEQTSK